jgi:hypothetical protein
LDWDTRRSGNISGQCILQPELVLLGSGKPREWKNPQGELLLRLFFLLQCFNGPNRPAELRIFDLLDVF